MRLNITFFGSKYRGPQPRLIQQLTLKKQNFQIFFWVITIAVDRLPVPGVLELPSREDLPLKGEWKTEQGQALLLLISELM